ncbi:Aste57867_8250 [Aphanomyces stellatus]|uniref:Aste57867_8250 protein n=1 Tax=Aphanomyces stellatus TaxID=120398 RepID=A0A485KJT2_9STRA|nr:hypothetical protein As57867_008219 [Aphanomyces stellatus]VFT85137.1 Aste57867_8250 [Aphanomyces stellatus]
MHTSATLHALVATIHEALTTHAMDTITPLANEPMGRCFLGLAGFLEYAKTQLALFLKDRMPSDEHIMTTDHAPPRPRLVGCFGRRQCSQLGLHNIILKLLVHDDERIQERASEIVVNSSSHNCNTSGINISFPYQTLPLEPPTRTWPVLQALPHDSRDENDPVVMIRAVKRRMTGQPKTGYLLWGAAVILARWIHLHRDLFHGRSVLEVGSGLGLSGIVAGSYSDKTTLTDYQQDTLNALAYNVALNQTAPRVDMVIASDIICDPTTAEGFCNVIKTRLRPSGVAYLVNATSHSRFGVVRLQELLRDAPFETTIVPVESLPDGAQLLDTVWDAKELKYEHYTIRLK